MSQSETPNRSLIKWIIVIGLSTSTVVSALFVLLYSQSGVWQMLAIAGLGTLCILCLAAAAWLLHAQNLEAAAYWTIAAVLVGYGGSELVADGITLHLTVGGIVMVLAIGNAVLPRRARTWLLVAGLFGAYIWLVNRFDPLPRADLAGSSILRLYVIPATTSLVLLMVLWRLLRARHRITTIRSRLIIDFALLALLPVAVISTLSATLAWQSGRQQVINQLESVAILKEAEINTWVAGLQTNLVLALHEHQASALEILLQERAATTADVQTAYDDLQEHFAVILEEAQLFEEIFLMDLQGQVILSTDAAQEGKILRNQTYFWEGQKEAHVYPPFYSPSLDRMTVVAVRPLVDHGIGTLGILAGRASMATLNEIMLERAGLGETGETYLVGENNLMLTGSRLARPDEVADIFVHTEGTGVALDSHVNGAGLYNDYRDVPVVGVYRWLPELQVALLAEQNQSEAFRPVYTVLAVNAGVAAVAVLAAIVAALFLADSIAAPLANLSRTARRIAAGDLSVRAQGGRGDEIGRLADSFNHMVEGILQAQQSLRESEERFRRLSEAAFEAITIHEGGIVLSANDQFFEMFGYEPDELLGTQAISQIVAPEARAFMRKQIATGNLEPYESIGLRKDGTKFPMEIRIREIEYEGRKVRVGALMDITERKRAEKEVSSARAFLDTVVDMSPFSMWVSDNTGTVIRTNHALREAIHLADDQIVGRYNVLKDQNLEITGVMPQVRAVFEKHQPARFSIPWKAGQAGDVDFEGARDMFIDVAMFPILDEQRELTNVVCQWVDITERKQAEQALREAYDTLEQRVRERTAELQRFVNLMAGREVRMAELKKVIKKLRAQLEEAGLEPVADDPPRVGLEE